MTQKGPLFYIQLAQEILVHLRAGHTQSELSSKLGYSFNQLGKWESGATAFSWKDFTAVCEVLNIKWQEHFNQSFCFHTDMSVENSSVFDILTKFYGRNDIEHLSQVLHKSKSSISRMSSDSVKIDLAEVLRIVDHRPFVMTGWLSKFMNLQKLELLKDQHQEEIALASGVLALPWSPLVNACLSLVGYRSLDQHSDEWIAEHTGLTSIQVQQAIQRLLDCKTIYFNSTHYCTYAKEFTLLKTPEMRKVTHFISETFTRCFKENTPPKPNMNNPSLTSTRIYPMSSTAGKKVAEALVQFHHTLNEILRNDSEAPDHVRAVLIQSVDMLACSQVSKNENNVAKIETTEKPLEH